MSDPLNDLAKALSGAPVVPMAQRPSALTRARGVVDTVNSDGTVDLYLNGGSVAVPADVLQGVPVSADTTVDVLVDGSRLLVIGVLATAAGRPTATGHVATNEPIASGAVTFATLTKDFAYGGMTFGTTGIVVPVTGIYHVSASAYWDMSGAGLYECLVSVNNTSTNPMVGYLDTSSATYPYNSIQIAKDIALNADDAVFLSGYQSTGADKTLYNGSWLSIHLVNQTA